MQSSITKKWIAFGIFFVGLIAATVAAYYASIDKEELKKYEQKQVEERKYDIVLAENCPLTVFGPEDQIVPIKKEKSSIVGEGEIVRGNIDVAVTFFEMSRSSGSTEQVLHIKGNLTAGDGCKTGCKMHFPSEVLKDELTLETQGGTSQKINPNGFLSSSTTLFPGDSMNIQISFRVDSSQSNFSLAYRGNTFASYHTYIIRSTAISDEQQRELLGPPREKLKECLQCVNRHKQTILESGSGNSASLEQYEEKCNELFYKIVGTGWN